MSSPLCLLSRAGLEGIGNSVMLDAKLMVSHFSSGVFTNILLWELGRGDEEDMVLGLEVLMNRNQKHRH